MITSAGARCDICDGYILTDKSVNPFKVKGIEQLLHCHDKCKETLIAAQGDFKKLPEGRLRKAFEKVTDEEK